MKCNLKIKTYRVASVRSQISPFYFTASVNFVTEFTCSAGVRFAGGPRLTEDIRKPFGKPIQGHRFLPADFCS